MDNYVNQWGEKSTYSIDPDEIETILYLGGKLVIKTDNGDGTCFIKLVLEGKSFVCITADATH